MAGERRRAEGTETVDILTVLLAGTICTVLATGAWKARILDEGGAISAFLIGFVQQIPFSLQEAFLELLSLLLLLAV